MVCSRQGSTDTTRHETREQLPTIASSEASLLLQASAKKLLVKCVASLTRLPPDADPLALRLVEVVPVPAAPAVDELLAGDAVKGVARDGGFAGAVVHEGLIRARACRK